MAYEKRKVLRKRSNVNVIIPVTHKGPCTCEDRRNTIMMDKNGCCLGCGRQVTEDGQWVPKK